MVKIKRQQFGTKGRARKSLPAKSLLIKFIRTKLLSSHIMPRKTRSQNQPVSSSTSPQASSPEDLRRPGKERIVELAETDTTQMVNHQMQLEETVGGAKKLAPLSN